MNLGIAILLSTCIWDISVLDHSATIAGLENETFAVLRNKILKILKIMKVLAGIIGSICKDFSIILKINLAAISLSKNWSMIWSKISAYQPRCYLVPIYYVYVWSGYQDIRSWSSIQYSRTWLRICEWSWRWWWSVLKILDWLLMMVKQKCVVPKEWFFYNVNADLRWKINYSNSNSNSNSKQ